MVKGEKTDRFIAECLPGEEKVVDVGRNGDDEVERVLVDDTLANVVQLCWQTYQPIHKSAH